MHTYMHTYMYIFITSWLCDTEILCFPGDSWRKILKCSACGFRFHEGMWELTINYNDLTWSFSREVGGAVRNAEPMEGKVIQDDRRRGNDGYLEAGAHACAWWPWDPHKMERTDLTVILWPHPSPWHVPQLTCLVYTSSPTQMFKLPLRKKWTPPWTWRSDSRTLTPDLLPGLKLDCQEARLHGLVHIISAQMIGQARHCAQSEAP